MTESLTNIIMPAPYVVVFLVVVLLANIYLVLSNYKNRYMLWWAKKTVNKMESRLKDEVAQQVLREEQMDEKIAEVEKRLEESEFRASINEQGIEHLHTELTASVLAAKKSAGEFLGEFKQELLRGVSHVERLELKLGGIHIGDRPMIRVDDTLSYSFGNFQKLRRATPSPPPKQFKQRETIPEIPLRQLQIPGIDVGPANREPIWVQAWTEKS